MRGYLSVPRWRAARLLDYRFNDCYLPVFMDVLTQSSKECAFVATKWTVILEAASIEAPGSQAAFARLYQDYWNPLYGYVRRRGYSPAEAEDITQDFFVALLQKHRLSGLAREGGRFRTFLLAGLKNHLANYWDHTHAAKRGGGSSLVSLDAREAENDYPPKAQASDPELAFEQEWAFAVLEMTLRHLENEMISAGKGYFFKCVQTHLQGDRNGRSYGEIAAELGMSEGALKVAVHRLRRRYGELLRAEIARTILKEEEVAEELDCLMRIVAGRS
jgi:RNA polymerase sigma factor (sigma-70 family)